MIRKSSILITGAGGEVGSELIKILSHHQDVNLVTLDLHPISNKNSSGFLPEEREWLSLFLELGFKDTFREINPNPHHYSWWSYRARARENNKGWRIDYHMLSKTLKGTIRNATIMPEANHSDHCPILLELN